MPNFYKKGECLTVMRESTHTSICSMSCLDGAEAVILSLLIRLAPKIPLAKAVAILPAPIKPTEDSVTDILSFVQTLRS